MHEGMHAYMLMLAQAMKYQGCMQGSALHANTNTLRAQKELITTSSRQLTIPTCVPNGWCLAVSADLSSSMKQHWLYTTLTPLTMQLEYSKLELQPNLLHTSNDKILPNLTCALTQVTHHRGLWCFLHHHDSWGCDRTMPQPIHRQHAVPNNTVTRERRVPLHAWLRITGFLAASSACHVSRASVVSLQHIISPVSVTTLMCHISSCRC